MTNERIERPKLDQRGFFVVHCTDFHNLQEKQVIRPIHIIGKTLTYLSHFF